MNTERIVGEHCNLCESCHAGDSAEGRFPPQFVQGVDAILAHCCFDILKFKKLNVTMEVNYKPGRAL